MARQLQPCGTVAAAFRHSRRGEPVCAKCQLARTVHSAVSAVLTRRYGLYAPPRQHPRHGTPSKYKDGCRCQPCTAAVRAEIRQWRADHPDYYAAWMRDYRRRLRRAELRGSLTHILCDYLETHGPILTEPLLDLIVARHPDLNRQSLRRTLYRLRTEDHLVEVASDGRVRLAVDDWLERAS